MANKQQVIDLNLQHPDWTARDVADRLGCTPQYVAACRKRYGLKFAKAKGRVEQPNSVYALGREARRAGLTVIAIQEIGKARSVSL